MQNSPIAALKQRIISRNGLGLIGLVLLNVLLFSLTDPIKSAPIIVILGFLVVGVDVYLIVHAFIGLLGMFIRKIQSHRRRLTVLFTGFFILCLGLGSIGQLTWRDLLVVVIVAAVGYFYSLYFRVKTSQ